MVATMTKERKKGRGTRENGGGRARGMLSRSFTGPSIDAFSPAFMNEVLPTTVRSRDLTLHMRSAAACARCALVAHDCERNDATRRPYNSRPYGPTTNRYWRL